MEWIDRISSHAKTGGKEKALIPCMTALCNGILDLCIYGLAIMKALHGEISTGMVLVYISSIRIFTQAALGVVNTMGEMMGFGELLEPYFTLLEIPEEQEEQEKEEIFVQAPYILEVQNVYFRYPDTKEWVLQNVSCTFKQGEATAIVGINGSGKSTLIKLLCRFYEPQKGCIRLNGIDIRHIPLVQYRRLISAVFQDFFFARIVDRGSDCLQCPVRRSEGQRGTCKSGIGLLDAR